MKYSGIRFDVVIAMQETALDFVEANRDKLFPETPIVFVSMTDRRPAVANETGIRADPRLGATLDLAAALQPDLRQVFVVTGASSTDKTYEKLAREQLKPFQSRFAVTYLAGLPMRELEGRLATLPLHSMVFSVMVYQDGEGDNFHPLEALERVTAGRERAGLLLGGFRDGPWHCRWRPEGPERSRTRRPSARLAVRRLRGGNSPTAFPISLRPISTSAQVDWRQRAALGHHRSASARRKRLVRFREPSAAGRGDDPEKRLGVAIRLLLAQTCAHRRAAGSAVETAPGRGAAARESGGALRTSYERIRALGARLLLAQEGERSRIARELHDDVSQQMALRS